MRRAWVLLGMLAGTVVTTDRVQACVCLGSDSPDFNHAMLGSTIVLVGEVTAQGKPVVPKFYPEQNVAYIDVVRLQAIKDDVVPSTIRIWDASFGTDCSYDLRRFTPGVVAAFAIEKNTPEQKEYWDLLQLAPSLTDYVVGGCGEYHKVLSTRNDAKAFAATAKRWLAGPH